MSRASKYVCRCWFCSPNDRKQAYLKRCDDLFRQEYMLEWHQPSEEEERRYDARTLSTAAFDEKWGNMDKHKGY